MGRSTEKKYARVSTQSLQPLHLQLPFLRGEQSEQVGFPIRGMECGEPGYLVPSRGPLGEQGCDLEIRLAIRHRLPSRAHTRRLDLPNDLGILDLPPRGVVFPRHILFSECDPIVMLSP